MWEDKVLWWKKSKLFSSIRKFVIEQGLVKRDFSKAGAGQPYPGSVRYFFIDALTKYKLKKLNTCVFKMWAHLYQFDYRYLKEKSWGFFAYLWHYLRSSVSILLQPFLHHSRSSEWCRLEDDSWQLSPLLHVPPPPQGKNCLKCRIWGWGLLLSSDF